MTKKAQQVLALINSSNGRIFSCEFVKKDKTLRHMVCRIGVQKGVNGKGLTFDPLEKGLKPVYDMQKQAWRMINLETTIALKVKGETHLFL